MRNSAQAAQHFMGAAFNIGKLSFLRLIVGLVRAKYAALVLGAAGIGLIAQGNNLFVLGVTVGSLSMSTGIIRRASSECEQHPESDPEAFLAVAFTSQLVAGLLMAATLLALSEPVGRAVFGEDGKFEYVLAVALAIPFGTLASGYVESVLFRYGRYDLYTRASSRTTLVGLLVFVILVSVAGVAGALWAITIGAVLLLAWFSASARRLVPRVRIFRLSLRPWRIGAAKDLWIYSAVTGVTSTIGAGALLMIRGYLIRKAGADANGFYQVPVAFTAYYTPFLTNALWARTLPAVSAQKDPVMVALEGDTAVRIVVLTSAVAVVGILSFSEVIIRIVYSAEFLGAMPVIPIQLAGDILYFVFFALSILALARRKLRLYLVGWLGFYALLTGFGFLFISAWGLLGAGYAYLTASTAMGIGSLVAYRRWVGRKRGNATIGLVATCSGVVGLQATLVVLESSYLLRVLILFGAIIGGVSYYGRLIVGDPMAQRLGR